MYEMQTFDTIMARALERVPDEYDTREGSVIYNALAPAAIELSQLYAELDNAILNTFPSTCDRDFLLKFGSEKGIEPYAATPAVVKLTSSPGYIDIPTDTIVSIKDLNYRVSYKIADGEYEAVCETPGTAGGDITSETPVIPVEDITGLDSIVVSEVMDIGTDEEDTEHFRQRYILATQPTAFGGNIMDYRLKTLGIEGVGACVVRRAGETDGNGYIPGGYVRVYILDAGFEPASNTLVQKVQNTLDPLVDTGGGAGLAPIGHSVQVFSAVLVNVSLDLTVVLKDPAEGLENIVKGLVEEYFASLRKDWGSDKSGILIRRSKVEDAVGDLAAIQECVVTSIQETGTANPNVNLQLSPDSIPQVDLITITIN